MLLISPPLTRRAAFTLFELVAVLVIISILAGTVSLSVRGHVSQARLEACLDRLETLDGLTRRAARRQNGFAMMVFDPHDRKVAQHLAGHPANSGRTCPIPAGVEIEQMMFRGQRTGAGLLSVAVTPAGQTETYGLQLRASSGYRVWLVVLGVSGQCLRFEHESDVEQLLAIEFRS